MSSAPPSTSTQGQTQGRAFVREGYLYFSPNCQRPVIVNPEPYGGKNPFKVNRPNVALYRQPSWWTTEQGWMSFIPLAPTFLSFPFEPFNWLPQIVSSSVSVDDRSGASPRYVTKFHMRDDEMRVWKQKEDLLVQAAYRLRLDHLIVGTSPPLPSAFGYDKHHKSKAIATLMVSLSRNWFAIWMGFLGYVIQQVENSPLKRRADPTTSNPYWYQHLLNDASGRWSQAWLDGLASSTVLQFSKDVARAGVVIQLSQRDPQRPDVDFFLRCNVPVFIPWTSSTEEFIKKHSEFEHLRPPSELVQQALSFIVSSPRAPLAGLMLGRFVGEDGARFGTERVRAIQLQYPASDIVKIVSKAFLDHFTSIEPASATALTEVENYHWSQVQEAEAAAQLPQQGMLLKEAAPRRQRLFTDWKDFFRRRAANLPSLLFSATPQDKQLFANRKRQPPTVKTVMFVWERVTAPGGMILFTRNNLAKKQFEDYFEERRKIYNEYYNEWDIFPDFRKDKDAMPEDGVPPFRPPSPSQRVSYSDWNDDSQHDDEAYDYYTNASNALPDLPIPTRTQESSGGRSPFDPYAESDDSESGSDFSRSPSPSPPNPDTSNQLLAQNKPSRLDQVPTTSVDLPRSDQPSHSSTSAPPVTTRPPSPLLQVPRPLPPPPYSVIAPLHPHDLPPRPHGLPPRPLGPPPMFNSSRPFDLPPRPLNPVFVGPVGPSLPYGPAPPRPFGLPPPLGPPPAHLCPPLPPAPPAPRHPGQHRPPSSKVRVPSGQDHDDVLEHVPKTALPLLLQYHYGYTSYAVAQSEQLATLSWPQVCKCVGQDIVADEEDIRIRVFISILSSKTKITLPADLDDLNPRNFKSLRTLFDFSRIKRLRNGMFLFPELSSPEFTWRLAVRSPAVALLIVRFLVLNPTDNMKAIVLCLLKYAVPFNTLIHRRSASFSLKRPIVPRYRHKDYIFTAADYQSALMECRELLRGPVGRAALMHGGIIGRIARQFVSHDDVFDGPSLDVIEDFKGLAIDSAQAGYQYWDDALTEEEIAVLYCCFWQDTGYGKQVTYLSFFPPPYTFDGSGYAWLEWTGTSERKFQRIIQQNELGAKPRSPTQWRSELRGFPNTHRLLAANDARAADILRELCPPS